jgi:hypothetical protein
MVSFFPESDSTKLITMYVKIALAAWCSGHHVSPQNSSRVRMPPRCTVFGVYELLLFMTYYALPV